MQDQLERITSRLKGEELEKFYDRMNNYQVDSQDNIQVDFSGTNLEINKLDGIGLRVLRTVFSNAQDLWNNVEDLHFEDNLLADRKGETMFDYVEGPARLGEMYVLRNHIFDNIEKVTPLTFEEIVSLADVREEWKALCFTSNELDVSDHLEEVDTFTSKTKNHKGVPITYTLFKGTVATDSGEFPLTYVRTYDASTDRMFNLQVYNSITKAEDAAGCLVRIPKDMHEHLVALHRQGEKYIGEFDIDDDDPSFEQKMSSTPKYLGGKQYYDVLEFEA